MQPDGRPCGAGPLASTVEPSAKWCRECGARINLSAPPHSWDRHLHRPISEDVLAAAAACWALGRAAGVDDAHLDLARHFAKVLAESRITEQAVKRYLLSVDHGGDLCEVENDRGGLCDDRPAFHVAAGRHEYTACARHVEQLQAAGATFEAAKLGGEWASELGAARV